MDNEQYSFFSIIIPSYNRADELTELLTSIEKLNFAKESFEVIVADDGSTDSTSDLIKLWQNKEVFMLHYFIQQKKGPGAARNLGMENAKGDFFIFIDSDVILPEDWLKNIARELNKENADAFGGPDTYLDSFPPLLKAINYSMTSFITTGGLRGKKGRKLAKYYPRSFNMGLSKKLWQEIGGFGNLRHGQDIEFSHRIIRSGKKVQFVSDAHVYHKRRTSLKKFFRQVFNWGMARINLYKIDRTMLEPLHTVPAIGTLLTFLTVLFSLFFHWGRILLSIGIGMWFLILALSMLEAVYLYRKLRPAFLLPLVMPMQIYGYGFGFIINFVRRIVFKKGEKVGFKKNYYR